MKKKHSKVKVMFSLNRQDPVVRAWRETAEDPRLPLEEEGHSERLMARLICTAVVLGGGRFVGDAAAMAKEVYRLEDRLLAAGELTQEEVNFRREIDDGDDLLPDVAPYLNEYRHALELICADGEKILNNEAEQVARTPLLMEHAWTIVEREFADDDLWRRLLLATELQVRAPFLDDMELAVDGEGGQGEEVPPIVDEEEVEDEVDNADHRVSEGVGRMTPDEKNELRRKLFGMSLSWLDKNRGRLGAPDRENLDEIVRHARIAS